MTVKQLCDILNTNYINMYGINNYEYLEIELDNSFGDLAKFKITVSKPEIYLNEIQNYIVSKITNIRKSESKMFIKITNNKKL